MEPQIYNPLTKTNLADSVASELLKQVPQPLPPERFVGAGIYLIYYLGPFDLYAPIAQANAKDKFAQPIYVGKAVPAGARKGGQGLETPHGYALNKRLYEHAESIVSAKNLQLEDFRCRWLVVDEVFIPLGESLLISRFRPLWNLMVDGFGNHAPGGGRAKGKKPLWDVLHPGRSWASKLTASTTREEIEQRVQAHFALFSTPPQKTA